VVEDLDEPRLDLDEEADVAAQVLEDLLDRLVYFLGLVDDQLAAVELVARGVAPRVLVGRVLDERLELLGLDRVAGLFLRIVVERERARTAAAARAAALGG